MEQTKAGCSICDWSGTFNELKLNKDMDNICPVCKSNDVYEMIIKGVCIPDADCFYFPEGCATCVLRF